MTAPEPTILFVPGAWFHPSTYSAFLSALQALSFPTTHASYPSLDPSDPTTATASRDTEFVLSNFLLPLIETEGKDVVVVMHSYGGVPGSAAARGLGKARQRAGEEDDEGKEDEKKEKTEKEKKGGVLGLIFISSFVLAGGANLTDGRGGRLPGWVEEDQPSTGLNIPSDPIVSLFADIDPTLAKQNASQILPHATLAFKSPSPPPAWTDPGVFEGRLAYLICAEDRAIAEAGQMAMMEKTGLKWAVKEKPWSHTCPFLKEPEETARIMEEFVEGFLKVGS